MSLYDDNYNITYADIEGRAEGRLFHEEDVRVAVNKALLGVGRHHPSTDDVFGIFKEVFGDPLLGVNE